MGIIDKFKIDIQDQDRAGLELWQRIVELHSGTLKTMSILGEGCHRQDSPEEGTN